MMKENLDKLPTPSVLNSKPKLLSSLEIELATNELYEYASLADSNNTQRDYDSDWRQFLSWAKKRNLKPLPANSETVA